MISKSELVLIC